MSADNEIGEPLPAETEAARCEVCDDLFTGAEEIEAFLRVVVRYVPEPKETIICRDCLSFMDAKYLEAPK